MNKISLICLLVGVCACKAAPKKQQDSLYSRHLQRAVQLTIFNTPLPDDKSQLNLLILNDGQEADRLRLNDLLDSLYKAKAIKPLVVVAVHSGDRMQEYGVADKPDFEQRGSRAGYYDAFVNNELYPFIKKKAGVRKFNTVAIAGFSLGALSAFDIAWNHADKIDKAGIFSGSFWWRDKDLSDTTYKDDDNRIMIAKLKDSRKKPHQQYWFYAGGAEESSDRDKDGIIDVVDDTKDVIALVQKRMGGSGDVQYVEAPAGRHDWPDWSAQLPAFLVWAFGNQ
ncbi:alpha/beta hydrolase-fold protein [Paraflavitalea sp. CAU 1676]|uniref:alpha/beta hydrolase n=1 Tax=Paraflavitalea sp. CAU 1676 TaxID=3032598 RepID=UPI0023D9AA5D|nr:alpha/beta hydrolase-fold protein [Paraflavitalea sp. CAU 1676]MDF2193097.1 alpha/beta hydrolase-fold protein [Paraflavitalea sp. CAU 1676]